MPRFKMLSKALWPMGFLLLGLACGPVVESQVPIQQPTVNPVPAGSAFPQAEKPAIIAPFLPGQHQGFTDLALDSQGNYVVTWIREVGDKQAVIYARRFDADGKLVGESFQVNEQPFSLGYSDFAYHYYHRTLVEMNQDGSFCIAWNTEQGLFMKVYDALGNPLSSEQRVADKKEGSEPRYYFSLAFANEKILLAWVDSHRVVYQIFSKQGEKIGSEVKTALSRPFQYDFAQISQDGTVFIFSPNPERIQKFKSGEPIGEVIPKRFNEIIGRGINFAVNELDQVLLLEERGDHTAGELYAHLYDATGNIIWQDLNIHTQEVWGITNPSVQLTKNYFTVIWQDENPKANPKAKVMGRRFDIRGQALEEAFEISTHDFEVAAYPSLALNEAGKMVVAWHGWNPDYKNTSTLYQRSYLMSEPLPASLPLIPKPEPVCGPEYDTEKLRFTPLEPGPAAQSRYEASYVMLKIKRYSCLSEILKHYEKYEPTMIFDFITSQSIGFALDKLSLDEARRMVVHDPLALSISDERLFKTYALYTDIYNRFHGWLDDLYLGQKW